MGVLSDFVEAKFGVKTVYKPTPLNTVVAVTPTPLWVNNPDRLMLVFMNLGANVVYLNTTESVADDNGFYLGPTGGSVVLKAEDDGELVGYAWYGIAAGNTNIFSAETEGM